MALKIKITKEFEEETKKVAEHTRKMMTEAEEQIKLLFNKANKEEWYIGPPVIIEELLYDFCLNTKSFRSWTDYCGADIVSSSEISFHKETTY